MQCWEVCSYPQDLTDLETIWDLLQEGPQDLRVCRILYTVLLDLLTCCLQYLQYATPQSAT